MSSIETIRQADDDFRELADIATTYYLSRCRIARYVLTLEGRLRQFPGGARTVRELRASAPLELLEWAAIDAEATGDPASTAGTR